MEGVLGSFQTFANYVEFTYSAGGEEERKFAIVDGKWLSQAKTEVSLPDSHVVVLEKPSEKILKIEALTLFALGEFQRVRGSHFTTKEVAVIFTAQKVRETDPRVTRVVMDSEILTSLVEQFRMALEEESAEQMLAGLTDLVAMQRDPAMAKGEKEWVASPTQTTIAFFATT